MQISTSVAIYSIVALSLALLIGRVGLVSLNQIALLAVGGWVALRLGFAFSLPFPVLLLATGVRDVLPSIDGAEKYYGRGVHHCPYCDGWEQRDQRLAAYGGGHAVVALALGLKSWSADVVACTDGGRSLATHERHGYVGARRNAP